MARVHTAVEGRDTRVTANELAQALEADEELWKQTRRYIQMLLAAASHLTQNVMQSALKRMGNCLTDFSGCIGKPLLEM